MHSFLASIILYLHTKNPKLLFWKNDGSAHKFNDIYTRQQDVRIELDQYLTKIPNFKYIVIEWDIDDFKVLCYNHFYKNVKDNDNIIDRYNFSIWKVYDILLSEGKISRVEYKLNELSLVDQKILLETQVKDEKQFEYYNYINDPLLKTLPNLNFIKFKHILNNKLEIVNLLEEITNLKADRLVFSQYDNYVRQQIDLTKTYYS